jgi:hypothetical protein
LCVCARAYVCRVRGLRCAGLLSRLRLCCVIYRVRGVRLPRPVDQERNQDYTAVIRTSHYLIKWK